MHVRAFSWQYLESTSGLALRWRFASTPCIPMCPGLQRLGFCGGGSLSPTCKLDAGRSLGQGWCGACDQQCSPSFVHVKTPEGLTSISIRDRACKPKMVKGFRGCQGGQVSRPNADTTLDFSKPSASKSGGFKHSGRRSVTRHSEAVPSPSGGFFVHEGCQMVAEQGIWARMRKFEGLVGQHTARCPRW